MKESDDTAPLHISLNEARTRLRASSKAFVKVLQYADCSVELYSPKNQDTQQPHEQDELYIISAGTGTFRCADRIVSFVAGDVLFVAARVPHRFESFSDDFETFVVFLGPQGGSKSEG